MSFTKKEAADYLAITIRAIENAVAKGKLDAQKVKGARGIEWRFEQTELDRYKTARETVSFVTGNFAPPVSLATQDTTAILEKLVAVLEQQQQQKPPALLPPPTVSVAEKLTLSLEEASQLSGFSTTQLREAIKAEKLRTVPVGTTGKRKRIRREDLDMYVKKL